MSFLAVPRTSAVSIAAPESVHPFDRYTISILAQPNDTGTLFISEGNEPLPDVAFVTDGTGLYTYTGLAPRTEMTLFFTVTTNRSGAVIGTIPVVPPTCTTTNAPTCLGFVRDAALSTISDFGFYIALLLLLLNLPALLAGLAKYRREASMTGAPHVRELAKLPVALGWTLLAPVRFVSKTLPAERLAIEMKRREKLDELVAVARYARTFDYGRTVALVRKVREVVDLYKLERGALKRPNRERVLVEIGKF